MQITRTLLPDIILITPDVYRDARGYFFESYNEKVYQEAGIAARFVQTCHSYSVKNTLRGLHYQKPHPQGKLIGVVKGAIRDLVVDVRRASPTFGQHIEIRLSDNLPQMLWIPEGFAHGFLTVSDEAHILYQVTDFYFPKDERVLLWNDPALGIPWNIADPILSDKDKNGTLLSALETY
ncbi:MAG: dTDP-4-dehydrorhamnose 3,5-epimerase [Burkholderiales bacterium]|jgi:dTDP-4-dehydrorhamnose 3,5-epimerase|nr:dTDP-4-dehydrorhamnose 3,5-epimerase [Burkholderiales bacterium]